MNDEQAIRDAQQTWFKATAASDLDRVLALMTPDVVFLTPGRPPFGRDEFTKAFRANAEQIRLVCEGELEEIVVAGDFAHARAKLSVTVVPLDGAATLRLSGYTLSIYRRMPDGRWLLARDANLLAPEVE